MHWLENLTLLELKAFAYDLVCERQDALHRCGQIEQHLRVIDKRIQELNNAPPSEP